MKFPDFTASDRRAMTVLAVVAVLAVLAIAFWGTAPQHDAQSNPVANTHDSVPGLVEGTFSTQHSASSASQPTSVHNTLNPAPFDPNEVDSATLVSFGLSPKKVHTFMRYRGAGAVFRKPGDIARCYSFSAEDVERMLPFVRIAECYSSESRESRESRYSRNSRESRESRESRYSMEDRGSGVPRVYSNKFTSLTKVNINTADTALLRRIPGVGEGIASMILNLRQKLGGFTSVSQLSQIQYVSPEMMEWFEVGENDSIRCIHINTASFKTLVSHPYISSDQTKQILNYIRLYGPIENLATLRSTNIFTADELERLSPYLEF